MIIINKIDKYLWFANYVYYVSLKTRGILLVNCGDKNMNTI